jgi:hypothetical protein
MGRRFFPILLLAGAIAFGQQSGGELRLSVHDAAGAAMPAHAELSSQSSGTHESVDVAADGRYSFKHLPFGFYRLAVTRAGFTPYSELVEIRSELPVARTVALSVQSIHTEVTIEEAETLIDPDRTGGAYYAGARQVKERQSGQAGRDLIDLVAQQPGWLLEANGVLHPRGSEYSTQYIVNGFPVEDNRSPAFAPALDADDVQSVKAYTSGIPAEFGRKTGGVIEVNTDRNTSPGFHGSAALHGGSFASAGAYLSGQLVAGRTTATVAGDGFATDRYLDPPVLQNFTNHGSGGSATATLERDLDNANRLRFSVSRRETWFQVPDELLQAAAGQRQDRTGAETSAQASYQHVFSASLLGSVRAMYRDVGARLWSNPLATPISAQQDRGFREGYAAASVSGHNGRHEWKAGADAEFASIREEFGYRIVAYRVAGVRIFDRDTPATLSFAGRAQEREQSAYAQDLMRLGPVTVSAGLRFDRYRLLVDETGWSPRLGAAWNVRPLGLTLRASYDRVFGTPAMENILLSASPALLDLNNAAVYLPLRPSRGNYWEAGFTKPIARRLRLDANVYRRSFRNFGDDDVLLNTGVSFPVSVDRARIHGVEVKLDVPRWGPFSGYLSYSNMTGVEWLPISGGLFLEDTAPALLASHEKLPVTQDQRNTVRALLRAQIVKRLWVAGGASYNSGLPIEDLGQSVAFLESQYGAGVVARANLDRGRVWPSFALNASIGAELWRHEKRSVSAQADILNVTDRLNVINFAGVFSGTAVAPPRSFGVRLRVEF